MSFICEKCHKTNIGIKPVEYWAASGGRCESCGNVAKCYDCKCRGMKRS